jgi:hypothetical protein
MKLFRHGGAGSERAGAFDAREVKRDLSLLVPDITPEWLSPRGAYRVEALHADGRATADCVLGESVYLGELRLIRAEEAADL